MSKPFTVVCCGQDADCKHLATRDEIGSLKTRALCGRRIRYTWVQGLPYDTPTFSPKDDCRKCAQIQEDMA